VIAKSRGSMPEIIEDGRNGFLVNGPEETISAIGRIGSIDRQKTSDSVARRFSIERMADHSRVLYHWILAGAAPMPGTRPQSAREPRRASFWPRHRS
jgi:glycosyltransferase involved in cell wall biosynthesis